MEDQIAHEIELLKGFIERLGDEQPSGNVMVTYGVLFDDDECQQSLETLMGTLKAARKRGMIQFEGQLLLKGVHDATEITLLRNEESA